MTHFTDPTPDDIDAALAQDARDLKTILFNHKDTIEPFRASVTARLIALDMQRLADTGGANAYRILLRNILTLGSSLLNAKEFRDLFTAIIEKIVEPAQLFGWSEEDLDMFLTTVLAVFEDNDVGLNLNIQKKFKKSLSKLIMAVRLAAGRFYTPSKA